MTTRFCSLLRVPAPPLSVLAAAPPFRIAAGEGVDLPRHFDDGAGHIGIAGVVLALLGINVPLLSPAEAEKGLIGVAVTALDGNVPDVDLLGH